MDTLDAASVAARLTPDVRMAFGNRVATSGREAAREQFAATAAQLQAVRHDITGVWAGRDEQGDVVSVEANVHYTRTDGRRATVPATSTLRLRDGLVRDYRIFIDTSPVFGR